MAKYLAHGNSFLYMAVNNGNGSYATPQRIEGLISAEMENESESENFYADNIAYATLSGAKSKKISLKVAQLIKWFMTYGCGYKYDANGMSTPTGSKRKLAVMWCEQVVDVDSGEEHRRLHIFYNCMLNGQPKLETETDEDKAKVSEIELEFTATANENIKDSNGNAVDYVVVDESEDTRTIFDNLGTSVYVPTFA